MFATYLSKNSTMNQTTPSAEAPKIRSIVYWILTGYLAFESILSATWDFNWLNKGYAIGIMKHLGYSVYFLFIKGIGTLFAAPVFILPGMRVLKEWAYFGTFMIYTGSIVSHLAIGDGFKAIVLPLIFLSITVASWALRPISRRFRT
jgi:hypothetical protein